MRLNATIAFEDVIRQVTADLIASAQREDRAEFARRFAELEAKLNERPVSVPKAVPQATFARLYGISTTTVWRLIRSGKLPFVVVGKRRLVLLPQAQTAAP